MEIQESHHCAYCCKTSIGMKRCSSCKTLYYCSVDCQKQHWPTHRELCTAIRILQVQVDGEEMGVGDSVDQCVYGSHMTPKQQGKMAQLVGEKCVIDCLLDGQQSKVLWDTGAQVSVIAESMLSGHLARNIRDVSQLLGNQGHINLQAANGTSIPYTGWVEIAFKLIDGEEIKVPFLVTKGSLEHPIIGFNVIELIVKSSNNTTLDDCISKSFSFLKDTHALVDLIHAIDEESSEVCSVKSLKKSVHIPRKQTVVVPSRANTGPVRRNTPTLFQPETSDEWPTGLTVQESLFNLKRGNTSIVEVRVTNETEHDITLPGRTVLGYLQAIRSITPVEVKLK